MCIEHKLVLTSPILLTKNTEMAGTILCQLDWNFYILICFFRKLQPFSFERIFLKICVNIVKQIHYDMIVQIITLLGIALVNLIQYKLQKFCKHFLKIAIDKVCEGVNIIS